MITTKFNKNIEELKKLVSDKLIELDIKLLKYQFNSEISSFEYWVKWNCLSYCKLEMLKGEYKVINSSLNEVEDILVLEQFLFKRYFPNNKNISNRSTNPIDFELTLIRKEVEMEIFNFLFIDLF